MKRPKRTYLVNEGDIDTIEYGEPQEDLFTGESIVNAANKVFDFEQFKREQEKMLQEYNVNDAETINYVDDTHLDDVRENKNLKMAAKKISDKYKIIRRKRKAATSVLSLHKISETFVPTDNKRRKKQVDKATLIAAKKISKKYKKLYGRI